MCLPAPGDLRVASVIDRCSLRVKEAPACKKEERSLCVRFSFFLSLFIFFEYFFPFLFSLTLQWEQRLSRLRPELMIVARDSCILRSPAALKPDKD